MITLLRTIILYFVVIMSVRLLGKRQVGELQASELVVTLLISDLASVPMQASGSPMASGLIPILVLVVIELVLTGIMVKSTLFRKVFCGSPIIVIWNGVIDKKAMTRMRMTIEDLFEELRQQSIFNLEDVYCAIVETNGKLSVMLKETAQPATAEMLSLSPERAEMPLVVVSDGVPIKDALDCIGHDHQWLNTFLKAKKLSVEDVFIMTATCSGSSHIVTKKEVTQ